MRFTAPEEDLQPFLQQGENLLWSGVPATGLRLRAQDLVLIPFSVVWCGFAIFWTLQVPHFQGFSVFSLVGFLFVAAGLYFVAGRFFWDAFVRKGTVYGVTNHRVLILAGGINRELRSLQHGAYPGLTLRMHRDGRGTIVFGVETFSTQLQFWSRTSESRVTPPAFEFIANPTQVHKILTALASKSGT